AGHCMEFPLLSKTTLKRPIRSRRPRDPWRLRGRCAPPMLRSSGGCAPPAQLNGLVGLKPTVGAVSGQGIVPISPRQDTAGPMCRTVSDAAMLAAVIYERAPGFGAHGTDLEAFRLRGVRIGALPVPKEAHPDTARLFADARAALEHEGAVIVDLKPPAGFDEMDAPELEALLYEFKPAINAYLAT